MGLVKRKGGGEGSAEQYDTEDSVGSGAGSAMVLPAAGHGITD